jgi:alkyl hydroperoxide reductase subunit AhpF
MTVRHGETRSRFNTTSLHRTIFGGQAAGDSPTLPLVSTFDFIVIGSGPAGRRAAIQAAKLGRSVLVVEKGRRVGGGSVQPGSIPS